jgi:hypothetical protein
MHEQDPTDPFDSVQWRQYASRALEDLVPKMAESAITVSLVPEGETDIKFALELGLAIMLDKPILAVVRPGSKVPERLVRAADLIVEVDMDDPAQVAQLPTKITGFLQAQGLLEAGEAQA